MKKIDVDDETRIAPLSVAVNINEYFTEIDPKLASKIGNSAINFGSYKKKCASKAS